MSSHPRMCPRCGDLLGTFPGTSVAQCLQCGTRYRLCSGEWKCVAEAKVGGTMTSAEKGCTAPPSLPGVLDGGPHRPANVPAAPPAPMHTAPPHRTMIRFDCPKCKSVLQSPHNKVGATVSCPACKHVMQVPKPVVRASGRSWLILVSLLILASLGGFLLALKSRSSAEGESETTAKLVTPAQGTSPQTTPSQSAAKTPIRPGVLDRSVQPAEKQPAPKPAPPLPEQQTPRLKGEEVRPTTVVKIDKKVLANPGPLPPAATEPKSTVKSVSVPDKTGREIYQTAASVAKASDAPMAGASRIDELVFGKLKEKGITPAALCSDGAFVRRVYLDVIGTLPTAQEAKAFIKDTDPNKRQILIDRLLERKEYADYWAMKWGDILRVKSEFPINLWPNAVRSYHQWIRASVRDNLPYDQFARALLTSSGSNFRAPPVNFYRALQRKDAPNSARAVALTFMGVRPEAWPPERWSGMATFFAQVGYKSTQEWKEEIVFFDPRKPLNSEEAIFPDGTKASLVADQDPRLVFADWLITPRNPWFTRNIANRVWSWLVGRGIIHEVDDIRPDNLPSNPELLTHLEQELIAARYDLKHLYRVILNSKTYQLSCVATSDHPEAAALFASYPVRRLDAEVLIDAICQLTGTTERYSSPIPEPFTYLPDGYRAVSLPDASITSAFLEMFGRSPRDTGLESERNNSFTAAQKLHLLNSAHIQRKIEQGPGLAGLIGSTKAPQEMAEELYLTILSRYPTQEELAGVAEYARAGARGRRPAVDIAWALINSAEFLCRH